MAVPPHLVPDSEPANSASDMKKYGIRTEDPGLWPGACHKLHLPPPTSTQHRPVEQGRGRSAGAVLSRARSPEETPAVGTAGLGGPFKSQL